MLYNVAANELKLLFDIYEGNYKSHMKCKYNIPKYMNV